MPNINIGNVLLRNSLDIAIKQTPKVILESVNYYNQLVLKGDLDRARAQIKVEFFKNRQVAIIFFKKYKEQMCEEVKYIYKEFMEESDE